jgi:hypothetical protein
MTETTLNCDKIAETADRLAMRIEERFPDHGLSRISGELVTMSRTAKLQTKVIGRPNYVVRIAVGILIAAILTIVISLTMASLVDVHQFSKANIIDLLTAIESGTNEIVLIGLAIVFLVSLETRIKRSRILAIIHELRSLAHVIDMHQLTKDPGYFRGSLGATKSSPERLMNLPELVRYLEYCSELLSIVSKIAALYAQEMNDRVVLAAVSDIETLVTGLSQKIWQKIDIAGEIQHGRR